MRIEKPGLSSPCALLSCCRFTNLAQHHATTNHNTTTAAPHTNPTTTESVVGLDGAAAAAAGAAAAAAASMGDVAAMLDDLAPLDLAAIKPGASFGAGGKKACPLRWWAHE